MVTRQLPDGRNFMPFSNSDAKCLIENWVEERAVAEIDAEKRKRQPDETITARLLKDGHDGTITTAFCSHLLDLTTHLDSYRPIPGPGVRLKGSRAEALERMLYEKAIKEKAEAEKKKEEEELADAMRSVTSKDFNIDDFVPMQPAPTAQHDYRSEQPVTIWTEIRDRAHGISQTKPTFDTPFRRNAAFTKPMIETWDPENVKPYEHDHLPNM